MGGMLACFSRHTPVKRENLFSPLLSSPPVRLTSNESSKQDYTSAGADAEAEPEPKPKPKPKPRAAAGNPQFHMPHTREWSAHCALRRSGALRCVVRSESHRA